MKYKKRIYKIEWTSFQVYADDNNDIILGKKFTVMFPVKKKKYRWTWKTTTWQRDYNFRTGILYLQKEYEFNNSSTSTVLIIVTV